MNATSKERGPYARTALRRQQIAGASLEIVEELGHENLTTAEVARRASTSEATVLYHFPSKDHLLVAALDWRDRLDQGGVDGHPLRALAGSEEHLHLDLEEFRRFARASITRIRILRLRIALAALATTPGHPAQEYFRQHYARAVPVFSEIIQSWKDSGLADPDLDAPLVARNLLAAWDGLNTQWLITQDFDIGDALIEAVRRLTGRDRMETRRAVLSALDRA